MIPENIAARWSALWPAGHVPSMPWWCASENAAASPAPFGAPFGDAFGGLFGSLATPRTHHDSGWRTRCDGQRVLQVDSKKWMIFDSWENGTALLPKVRALVDPRKPEGWDTPEEAMVYADHVRPLPAPPPLCGQVWEWPDGEQHMVGRVHATSGATMANGPYYATHDWPPEGAILVAGPGSHGRDIPWMKL